MTIFISIMLFFAGLILIIKGGDSFVDAASYFARITGIPEFVIGATVVSFATTLPEIIVSLMATMHASYDMAVGNAIGSVCCNIGLVMGIAIIACQPLVNKKEMKSKGYTMIIATAFLFAFILNGRVSVAESVILIAILVIYILNTVKMGTKKSNGFVRVGKVYKTEILLNCGKFVLGAAAIIIGSNLLVENGALLARLVGISESIIGLTLMAIGTSLPELATGISAIKKGNTNISVGNIFGANIIDITLILGGCSLVSTGNLKIMPHTYLMDIPAILILMLIVVLPASKTGKLKKWQGVAILLIYITYVFLLINMG